MPSTNADLATQIQALGDPDLRELMERARAVSVNAYAPYSNYFVGASLRTTRGNIFSACNVENASLPISVCAERGAVSAAISSEGADMHIDKVAIYVPTAEGAGPCGACRQVIAQFGPDATVVFPQGGECKVMSVRELLPYAYFLVPRPRD